MFEVKYQGNATKEGLEECLLGLVKQIQKKAGIQILVYDISVVEEKEEEEHKV